MLQMFPIVRSAKLVSSSTLALDTHFPWLLVSTSVYELWIDKMTSSSRFIRLHLQLYQWKGNDPFYGNPLIGTVLQSSHYQTHPLSKLANGSVTCNRPTCLVQKISSFLAVCQPWPTSMLYCMAMRGDLRIYLAHAAKGSGACPYCKYCPLCVCVCV